MKHPALLLIFSIILILTGLSCTKDSSGPGLPDEIQKEAKPWAYWWWMGNSVSPEGITANLESYSRAGLGGLHVIPIYGERGDESNFIAFLSPRWMEMLKHTLAEAERLGLGIDMTCGTGWPFGGPGIGEEHAAKAFEVIEIHGTEPFLPEDLFARIGGLKLLSLAGYDREDNYMDIPFTLDGEGRVHWTKPAPVLKVYALFQRMTGQRVKRAAPGGEGLVVDYFSKRALQSYFQQFRKAFAETDFSSGKVRAFYNDSYEVYGANWTNDFLEHFERLRGYSLLPHISYFADTIETEERIRFKVDFLESISDLLREEFTQEWTDASHTLGFLTRYQAHGSPGNLIDLYSLSDIPETESFGRSNFPIPGLRQDADYREEVFGKPTPYCMKFASSAANLSNRRLVSSESATWLGDHFKVSLSQVKPQVDELFVSGINHIFYHGITYSPPEKPFPGRLFYASTNFGPHAHFWNELPALNQYVANCQHMLQNSYPDNDLLVYFPIHDVWARTDPRQLPRMFGVHHAHDWLLDSPFGDLVQDLWSSGYTFDYISDLKLEVLKVRRGKALAGTNSYRAILVPKCLTMPLHTLERLHDLARKGVPVIFEQDLPADVPGLHRLQERRHRFSELKATMRTSDKSRISAEIKKELRNSGIIGEGFSEQGVSFIRKRSGDQSLYFVTNLSSTECAAWIPMTVAAESIEMYDPLRGRRGLAEIRPGESGTDIHLQLAPGESRILTCFPGKADLQAWVYPDPDETQKIQIQGKWLLTPVEGAPRLPQPVEMEQLHSWTGMGEDWEIFSGSAVYSTTFRLPDSISGKAFLLELGDVRESARVRINDQDLGLLWSVPFRMIIPAGILKASNTLEIEVRNLSFNRVIDLDRRRVPWKNFHEINFVNIRYEPYDASRAEPMPSGLLDPLTITPLHLTKYEGDYETRCKDHEIIDKKTVKLWSEPYRDWHYHPDHVILPEPDIEGFEEIFMTDVPTVFRLSGDEKWYMSFIGYDGKGYQSFIAESEDLVHWDQMRLAMGYGPEGAFDHGGVVLGAYLYEDYGIKSPRILKKRDGKYYTLYGAYPRQGGYELRPGYEGVAWSEDGLSWERASEEPILSVFQEDCGSWEKDCIYQPWLVEHEGSYYNFYNAAKGNIEQVGLAASGDLINWERYEHNPVIPVGAEGSYNEYFSSDAKVFWDQDHWIAFFFGVGQDGAHMMAAFSRDLYHWTVDPEPLYKAGGNPSGLDNLYAHKISLVWNPANETFYMFYCAVDKGNRRGIGLITSRPIDP